VRAALVVAAREIAERKRILIAAAVAGLLPFLAPLFPNIAKGDVPQARAILAMIFLASFGIGTAVVLGSTILVRDFVERRAGFYFARPLPSLAIWGGKILAALLLASGAGLLCGLPSWIVSPQVTLFGGTPSERFFGGSGILFAGLLLVVAIFHAAAVAIRSRSPWLVVDIVLLVVSGIAVGRLWLVLARVQAPMTWEFPNWSLPVLLAALLVSGAAQVSVGRADLKRGHGAQSLVLWGILGSGILVLGGYAWWVTSARATDLASIDGGVMVAPRGAWVVVGGPLRAGRGDGMFLFDTTGDRSLRIRSGGAVFSARGTRAAWGEERLSIFEKGRKAGLFVADLEKGRAVETGLECSIWCRFALSPSGRRLAVFDGETLAAYEISDPSKPKQLTAIRVKAASRSLAFVDDDTVRLFPRIYNAAIRKDVSLQDLEIEEISLSSKKALVTGRFERDALPFLRMSADGRYLVGTREKRLTLHDGQTGALVATLAENLRSPQARFLTGDRIAVAGIAGASARLLFFEGQEGWGAPSRLVESGPAKRVVLGGGIAPGQVALSLLPFEEDLPASRRAAILAFVDVSTGLVSPGPDGLVPADRFSWWLSPVLPPVEAGLASSTFFFDAGGHLVRLDAATGERKQILPKAR
jgi:hypothetical protein